MTTAHDHQPDSPADAAQAEGYYQGTTPPQPSDPAYAAGMQDLRAAAQTSPPPPAAPPAHVDLDLDRDTTAVDYIEPFVVRLGGQTWTIEQPDGGTVMDIDEARTPRAMLALIFDDQWADVAHLIDPLHTDQIRQLVRQFRRHFELDEAGAQAAEQKSFSRADRRKLRRRVKR